MIRDNETVYDEQINPLVAQITAICKAHGIPMFATFEYDAAKYCTTYIHVEGESVLFPSLHNVASLCGAPR